MIVGTESRGFIFGVPIAYNLHKPFVPCLLYTSIIGFISMGIHRSQGGDILNYSLEFKGGTCTLSLIHI